MLVNGTYHRYIYLPDDVLVQIPTRLIGVRWSTHARQKAYENGIRLADEYSKLKVIEVELKDEKIQKVVYRHSLYSWADIVFPVFLDRMFAPTVWLTGIYDAHQTLDESRYVRE